MPAGRDVGLARRLTVFLQRAAQRRAHGAPRARSRASARPRRAGRRRERMRILISATMDSCREGALVEFRVLGPVELWTGDRRRELGSPKENCALAALLLSAGRTVSADALAERIWGEQPPHQARSTLQAYISRLRRHLKDAGLDNPMMLTTSAHGYRLDVPESCIDAARFETLARRAE